MVTAVPDAARSDLSTAIFAKMLTRACKGARVTYKRNALRSKGLAPKKFSWAKLIQVDNLTRRVSTSLMRTGIVSVHLTHAMGRSRAKTESDTSVLLGSITPARDHREIA